MGLVCVCYHRIIRTIQLQLNTNKSGQGHKKNLLLQVTSLEVSCSTMLRYLNTDPSKTAYVTNALINKPLTAHRLHRQGGMELTVHIPKLVILHLS